MNKKTILGYLIGPIGASFIGFISLPIMAWFFSAEDIGKISILQVATSLFVLVFCLGLDQAYVRDYHNNDKKELLFKMVLLPSMSLALFTCVFVFMVNQNIISWLLFDEKNIILTVLSICCFLVALLLRFLSLLARMQEKAFIFSFSQILQKNSFLVTILLFVWLGFLYDFYGLVIANLLSLVTACFLFIISTKFPLFYLFNREWDKEKFIKLIHFGLPLILAGIASWGMNTLDRVFLRYFSSFEELGLYAMTFSVVGIVGIFSGVFNTIWAPLVYKWNAEGNFDINKLNDILDYILMAIFFIVVIFGLFSWLIVFIFPPKYYTMQYILVPCLFAPLLYMLSEVTSIGISLKNKTKYSMYASITAVVVNCLVNLLLIPKYGALGASIATAIAFSFFYVLRTELSKKCVYINVFKSYIIVMVLLIMSVIHAVSFKVNFDILYLMWFLLIILGIRVFDERLQKVLQYCKKQLI